MKSGEGAPRLEESVAKLLPRSWRLVVEERNGRWQARSGSLLRASVKGYGGSRQEALENLETGLVELLLPGTVRSIGWAMIESDPADIHDYLTVLVTLHNRAIAVAVDLQRGKEFLERTRHYVAERLPEATMIVVSREAIADPTRMKAEVE